MPILFLLFIVVPVTEIALFVKIGGLLGIVPTLAIVIGTALLGTSMLRSQGIKTLEQARSRMSVGELPAAQLLEGMILLVGGVLLLTPGFLTDAVGFACLVPISRRWLAARISERVLVVGAGGLSDGLSDGLSGGPVSGRDADDTVIDGEYERLD